MALFRKRVTEIRKNLHEHVDNDAKSFRYAKEEDKLIKMKIKYVNKHMKLLIEQERFKEVPLCYGHLSVAYIKLMDYEEAKINLQLQIESGEEMKDEGMLRMAYSNLGLVHKKEYQLTKAMECYEESLRWALKHKNRYAQGRLYNNMANIMEMQMELEKGIEYHKKHLKLAEEMKDRDALVKCCGAIASLYHTLDDPPTAVEYLDKLIDQLRKNMKVLDTLADDADGSEPGGYINIEEPDEPDEDEDEVGGGGAKKTGFFSKIPFFGK